MIILREKLPKQMNFLKSYRESNGSIFGAEWHSSLNKDRLKIRIKEIIDQRNNFKSDFAES